MILTDLFHNLKQQLKLSASSNKLYATVPNNPMQQLAVSMFPCECDGQLVLHTPPPPPPPSPTHRPNLKLG